MSYFKAKMHEIRFRLQGLRPLWGAYSAPPDPLAVFKGPTFKWRGRGELALVQPPPQFQNLKNATGVSFKCCFSRPTTAHHAAPASFIIWD